MFSQKIVSLIAGVSENGVIGAGGKLPWENADDLKWFKHMTMGKTVIMGSKTFDHIPRDIMKTGDREFLRASRDGASIETLIAHGKSKEVFIAGGAEIYKYVIENKLVDRYYIGQIKGYYDGDTYFPPLTIGAHNPVDKARLSAREEHLN